MSASPPVTPAAPLVAGSRRAHGKARVRAGLLSAARRLFARQGVAATTMDDIARRAGVSRATTFNYFPSKHLLLEALVHEMEARFLQVIEAQLGQPATAAARVRALFSWTAKRVCDAPELSRVLIGASETTFGATRNSGVRTARVHRALMRVLQAGRREGNVRTDLSCEILAEIVGGSYAGMLHAWRVGRHYPLARRLAEAAAALEDFLSVSAARRRRERRGAA